MPTATKSKLTPYLKYLFVAEYNDGSVFVQPEHDRSITFDPKKESNKSSFADIDHSKLICFHLAGRQEDNLPSYTVDLRDGHFEVGGIPFIIHDDNMERPVLEQPTDNLKLIYFRETRQEVTVNTKGEQVGARCYVNRYFIGWETRGKNKIRRVIGVA